jgi:RNA polymerase sporulation-specific sigma factor
MYKELDDLLAKARKGDTKSTQLIIEKLNPLIISSIRRYYNKIMDYDDLIQEGRLVVLECIKDYDESKGVYFLGYVKIKLKFLYLNKHKEKITLSLNTSIGEDEDQELIDVLESEDGEILEEILKTEELEEIRYALASLTERQREVIIYFYFEGYSIPEIAKRMGVTYRTIVNTKTNALEKMKRQMTAR